MAEVAIVGAGEMGGALAHALARRNLVSQIRLVSGVGQVAAGKALDIAQSAPIEGFATRLSGSTDFATVAGALVVVLADEPGSGEWEGTTGLQVLRQVAGYAREAVFVCAGARQRELVDQGVRDLGLSVRRLFGTAPEALAAGARTLVAVETNGSAREVALAVLGRPPKHVVIPWGTAAIGGAAATVVLNDFRRRRIEGRLAAMWPPGPVALAVAAVEAVAALLGQSRRVLSCFAAPPEGYGGRESQIAALPVRLGISGVEQIVLPQLEGGARVAFENAMF